MTSEIPDFQVYEPPEKKATTQTEGPEQNEAGSQTEEFDYNFRPAGYQAPDHNHIHSIKIKRMLSTRKHYYLTKSVFVK